MRPDSSFSSSVGQAVALAVSKRHDVVWAGREERKLQVEVQASGGSVVRLNDSVTLVRARAGGPRCCWVPHALGVVWAHGGAWRPVTSHQRHAAAAVPALARHARADPPGAGASLGAQRCLAAGVRQVAVDRMPCRFAGRHGPHLPGLDQDRVSGTQANSRCDVHLHTLGNRPSSTCLPA